MADYPRGDRPEVGRFFGFHSCHWYVSNAGTLAAYYTRFLGFEEVAYRGLETGHRDACTHVVKKGRIVFAFSSGYLPDPKHPINAHVALHGDGVRDVLFLVDDVRGIYKKATERGATSVFEPREEKDENGTIITAGIQTYGDTIHTLVQVVDYTGPYMPGYKASESAPCSVELPDTHLEFIDHVVGNQPDGKMVEVADWYQEHFDFHRFWSVDDKEIHTEFSSLRSIVMTDYDRKVKMPINEPADGKRKSQIQEYVEYYGGAGVQHIAMNTPDILASISAMRARGQKFLSVPKKYYDDLRERLAHSPVEVQESLDEIERLNILVDFDDRGYLLQIFTKNITDRPTAFLEVIQRHGHEGFGAGNFKALFESIEREQEARGNL